VGGQVFRGRFHHNIDTKGRLNFPAKFRDVLSSSYEDKLIIVKYSQCLRAYPLSEWITFEKSKSQQYRNEAQEDTLRMVLSSLAECGFDKQGRILIPQNLRDYAVLSKEVVLIGMFKKIEIWDKGRLNDHEARVQESQDLGEALTQLGL
jgi:MraZ protein